MPNEKKYIDAVALIEELEYYRSHGNSVFYKNTVESDIKTVKQQPAADVAEARHGCWYNTENGYFCTLCNGDSYAEYDYCPRCGAKMDGKEENNGE